MKQYYIANLSKDDIEIIESLKGTQAIAIINKVDLENKIDINFIKAFFAYSTMVNSLGFLTLVMALLI